MNGRCLCCFVWAAFILRCRQLRLSQGFFSSPYGIVPFSSHSRCRRCYEQVCPRIMCLFFFFFFFDDAAPCVATFGWAWHTAHTAHRPLTRVGVVCIPALPLLGDSFDLDKASEVISTQGGLHTGLRVMLMRDAWTWPCRCCWPPVTVLTRIKSNWAAKVINRYRVTSQPSLIF